MPRGRGRRARAPPACWSRISGRNQLRGIVEEVRADGLLAQVRLRIGDQRLTAVITRDAVDELKLRRGDEALAIIKSTEVMIARSRRRMRSRPFDRLLDFRWFAFLTHAHVHHHHGHSGRPAGLRA